ncbi:MAG: lysophospholipid acyltransferase family protein [Calditrichaceae bacterium]
MKIIESFIRTILTYIVLFIATGIAATLAIIGGTLKDPYCEFNNRIIKLWARSILWISGTKLIIEGLENVKSGQPYIFVANHQSNFDVLATVVAIPETVRFIAKKELFRVPLFAQGMKAAGVIKIDRGNSASAKKSIDEAVNIVNHGVSVIVFPEGTRSKDGKIHAFKKGGFILALNGEIPIMPIVISGSKYVLKKHWFILKPGKIKTRFLKEIPTKNLSYDSRNQLVEQARNQIMEMYEPEFNKE